MGSHRVMRLIKNTIYAAGANISRILTTLVLTLLLPKVMDVADFSYWQLYGFYGIYLACSSVGWCEGTYLKYAGDSYDSLPSSMMSAQFLGLALWEAIFAAAVFAAGYAFIGEPMKLAALGLSLVYTWISILRYQLQTILQATNRIREYARVYSGERVLNFVLVMLCILTGQLSFQMIAGMEIISNFCLTGYAVYLCRRVIAVRPEPVRNAATETKELIRIGCKITLASLASQAIIGIVRFAIEQKWGTIVFGKISLSFSMANMLITCISSVSIVLFPELRRCDISVAEKLYRPFRTCMTAPMFGLLLFYAPAKLILSAWLPQYADSLRYLAILFPLCVYESRNMVLTWTYLKTIHRESDIMTANLIVLACSLALTGLSVFVIGNLELAVITIIVLYMIKAVITELYLGRKMPVFRLGDQLAETVLTAVFVYCSWNLGSIASVVVYAAVYAGYLLVTRKEIMASAAVCGGLLKNKDKVNEAV